MISPAKSSTVMSPYWLPELRAVRNGRVYAIHEEFVGHPSQFIAETAKVFARIIHPEAYSAGHP